MTRKNPNAVALGRKGGRASSPAKTAAVRANAAKPRPARREQYFADGWSAGVQRAAEMVRYHGKAVLGHSLSMDSMADIIAAEPAPRKDGGK